MKIDEVYEQYFHDVYLYMCSLTANSQIAEEMTQEAFFKALKALPQFDGRKDIRAWLFTIAKNTYFTHYNKQQRIIAQQQEGVEDIQLVEQLANKEQAFRIHRYIHRMDEPYKEVFLLRVFGELPFEQIGQLFGKSDSWARVTYYRAKKKLIQNMEDE